MILTFYVSSHCNSSFMKKYLFGFILAIGVVACAPKLTETNQEIVEAKEKPAEVSMSTDAIEGKKVYAKKCSSCHEIKVIDNYTAKQWAGILPDMSEKAKLNETSSRQVASYVNWELKH